MAVLRSTRVPAAALLEVLVAITLVVMVFTVGTLIYLQVTSSSFTGEKLRAGKVLDNVILTMKDEKSFFDEEIKAGELRVEKLVTKYDNNDLLLLVELKAYNSHEKLLAERREVVLVDGE